MSATVQFQPSPLQLGGTFTTSWRVFKSNFWTFLGLLLLPVLLGLVELIGVIAATVWMSTPGFFYGPNAESQTITIILLSLVGYFLLIVLTLRCTAAIYAGIDQVAKGRKPTISSALAASPGLFGRLAMLSLLYVLVIGAVIAVIGLAMFAAMVPLLDDPYASPGPLILVILLMYAVFIGGASYLGVKLFYLIPAMTVEGLGPIEGIRRSFQLTRGEFLRTVGYSALASLIVAGPLVILYYMMTMLAVLPFATVDPYGYGSSYDDLLSALGGSLVIFLISTLVYIVGSIVGQLYYTVFGGVMYIDRVRRERGEVVMPYPAYGYPGYGAQPYPGQPYPPQGQPYVQPGQYFPQGGHPFPAQAGQPYPQPGQTYGPQAGPGQAYGAPGSYGAYPPGQGYGQPGQPNYSAGQPGQGGFGAQPSGPAQAAGQPYAGQPGPDQAAGAGQPGWPPGPTNPSAGAGSDPWR